jgi:hypothetical protein
MTKITKSEVPDSALETAFGRSREPLFGAGLGPQKGLPEGGFKATSKTAQNRPKRLFAKNTCFQRPTKRNRTRIRKILLLFPCLPFWSKTRFKVLGRFGRFPGYPKTP